MALKNRSGEGSSSATLPRDRIIYLPRFTKKEPPNVIVHAEPGLIKQSKHVRIHESCASCVSFRLGAKEQCGDNFAEVTDVELGFSWAQRLGGCRRQVF